MKKQELIVLIDNNPILTLRTVVSPVTDEDRETFLNHAVASVSVSDDLADSFREKCWQEACDESAITFTVRLKDNNEYIGYFQLKRLGNTPEIGIDIIESYQRNGYGFEVCKSVIDYLFKNTEITVLQYNCFRSNIQSLALANKLGAVKVGERIMFEFLKSKDVSEEAKAESAQFDLMMYEIKNIHNG